jgi:hypothetical protein
MKRWRSNLMHRTVRLKSLVPGKKLRGMRESRRDVDPDGVRVRSDGHGRMPNRFSGTSACALLKSPRSMKVCLRMNMAVQSELSRF